jgi:hypothetical protein
MFKDYMMYLKGNGINLLNDYNRKFVENCPMLILDNLEKDE